MEERAPELPHREVERVRVKEHPGVRRAEIEPARSRREQARDLPMLHLHAFRPSGRTGRVDHICEVLGARARAWGVGACFAGRDVTIDADRARIVFGQPGEQVLLREQDRRDGVFEDVCEPVGRVLRVERDVRPARLEHAEDRHDELDRTFKAERDERLTLDSGFPQPMSEGVGAGVQLGVGDGRTFERQRRRVG